MKYIDSFNTNLSLVGRIDFGNLEFEFKLEVLVHSPNLKNKIWQGGPNTLCRFYYAKLDGILIFFFTFFTNLSFIFLNIELALFIKKDFNKN